MFPPGAPYISRVIAVPTTPVRLFREMNVTPRLRAAARVLPALAAALAAAAPAVAQDARPLTVFQINDVYRIDAVENGLAGGIGRVVTLARRAGEGGAPVMSLHAGDFIAPSLESQYFEGRQMIDALNYLHDAAPMLAVPGNHEFDSSRPGMLAGAVRRSRFPWLAGNLTLSTGDSLVDRRVGRDTVVTAPNGLRIGVFTLTFIDRPRTYAKADSAFVTIAEAQIRELERKGADVIVGLTHLALETDREIAKLRARHPKFLWIAGGHEHFVIHQPMTRGSALITKGASNARTIWRITLSRQGRRAPTITADTVPLDASVAVDPGYLASVQRPWADSIRARIPIFDQPIGVSATAMDASEETVRNAESAWGNWLADQMRGAFKGVETDAAVLNGGAMRSDDVLRDTLRYEHLARTFGFPTRVGVVWLRGRDVRAMLENSVSGGRGEGRFLQVSGLRVRFDRSRPEGQRVLDVQVRRGDAWAPLDPTAEYAVAVPDYLYEGGDSYSFGQAATRKLPPGSELRLMAFDALLAAWAAGRPIAPTVEGRLVDETPRAAGQR